MDCSIPNSGGNDRADFWKVFGAFLSEEGLPFAEILSTERIQRVFAKHDGLFGTHGVYTTAVTLWSFLSQVLQDDKQAACQAAVARATCYCLQKRIPFPAADTGSYCRARAKLPEAALRELSCEVAEETETAAQEDWLWKGKHAKLIDGFTFTMPDTPKNQAEYPQQKSQKPGIGFPIARAVTILSLATACVTDAAIGPYSGKETGETALLRQIMDNLGGDDVAVLDRYYCSFMMIALTLAQGTHVCARKAPEAAYRLSPWKTVWASTITLSRGRDQNGRSGWTRKRTPKSRKPLELREIRYWVTESGKRTGQIDVITTPDRPRRIHQGRDR